MENGAGEARPTGAVAFADYAVSPNSGSRPDLVCAYAKTKSGSDPELVQVGLLQEVVAVGGGARRRRPRRLAQDLERHVGAGRTEAPDAAPEVGEARGLLAGRPRARRRRPCTPALLGRAAGRESRRRRGAGRPRWRTCRATAAARAFGRPSFSMSSRIGSRRSIGTIMLPWSVPASTFSCTRSEPMPSSLPSAPISAAPPHCGCAGRGEDRLVEHVFPVAGELALREHRGLERVRAAAVARR